MLTLIVGSCSTFYVCSGTEKEGKENVFPVPPPRIKVGQISQLRRMDAIPTPLYMHNVSLCCKSCSGNNISEGTRAVAKVSTFTNCSVG